MPGVVNLSELPTGWEELGGIAYCLGCRRKLAGEAKVAALSDEHPPADRLRPTPRGGSSSSCEAIPTAATRESRGPAARTC
jgi:hypothetical protein